MNLFLDSSVLLAACGSAQGSSRAIFNFATGSNWILLVSPYAVSEVVRNLPKLQSEAAQEWECLKRQLVVVDDVVSLDRAVVFSATKDRPILFTALAYAETLLTLDRKDFGDLIGREFYGLSIMLPYEFLREERAAGRFDPAEPDE